MNRFAASQSIAKRINFHSLSDIDRERVSAGAGAGGFETRPYTVIVPWRGLPAGRLTNTFMNS